MEQLLLEPVSNAPLVIFRLLFGAALACFSALHWRSTTAYFTSGHLHVGYELTRFVRPLPQRAMQTLFALELVFAMIFSAGWLLPWAALVLLLIRGYVFLLDRQKYNNHSYLILLILLLYVVIDADDIHAVPRWHLLSVQLQICLVYFYGGLAKLNRDWLVGASPFRFDLLDAKPRLPKPIQHLFAKPSTAYLFCWAGAAFDLTIGFLLMEPRARPYVFIPFILFHVFNHWLYGLGVFPWMNYASVVLFLDFPRAPAASLRPDSVDPEWFFVAWFTVQLLVPLRRQYYALSRRVAVNSSHHHFFSWTMKLVTIASKDFKLVVFDRHTGKAVRPYRFDRRLRASTYAHVSSCPRALVLLLEQLEPELALELGEQLGLRARMMVSYNQGPWLQVIDPSADLRGQAVFIFAAYPWQRL